MHAGLVLEVWVVVKAGVVLSKVVCVGVMLSKVAVGRVMLVEICVVR